MANVFVQYDRASQTIICTSTGGPAANVAWYKDKAEIMIPNEGGIYEHSQIITDTVSTTYENRLRIVDKSSEAAGTYTCEVRNPMGSMNVSLYIQGNHKIAVTYSMHEKFILITKIIPY